jgi:hypothetical protein
MIECSRFSVLQMHLKLFKQLYLFKDFGAESTKGNLD